MPLIDPHPTACPQYNDHLLHHYCHLNCSISILVHCCIHQNKTSVHSLAGSASLFGTSSSGVTAINIFAMRMLSNTEHSAMLDNRTHSIDSFYFTKMSLPTYFNSASSSNGLVVVSESNPTTLLLHTSPDDFAAARLRCA